MSATGDAASSGVSGQAANQDFDPAMLAGMEAENAVDALVQHAKSLQASDLFFLSDEFSLVISVRWLGQIKKIAVVSAEQGRRLIGHIKATAGMDIADQRRPQDGRWIHVEEDEPKLDLRANSIPTLYGEDLTLRIFDHEVGLRDLSELGMEPKNALKLKSILSNPSGLILVTGPTGTGKTTTLYACLDYLNDGLKKINTLEDPIEYDLAGVRQSQIMPKIGNDFPELLRNVLRQSPDVIMIGEIRDSETAATAVRAANSGHLVLATLHAPVAAGAIQSMLSLGVHPFFLSSCLVGVIAQRLLRGLCPNCRTSYDMSASPQTFAEIQDLLEEDAGKVICGPNGCPDCLNEGYSFRTGVFEIMTFNQEVRRLVSEARPYREIEQAAIRAGMVEFRRAALLKVARGVTSTEEVLRDVPAEYLGLED